MEITENNTDKMLSLRHLNWRLGWNGAERYDGAGHKHRIVFTLSDVIWRVFNHPVVLKILQFSVGFPYILEVHCTNFVENLYSFGVWAEAFKSLVRHFQISAEASLSSEHRKSFTSKKNAVCPKSKYFKIVRYSWKIGMNDILYYH